MRSVAFAPDGDRLASAGDDGTVRIWDLASRQVIAAVAVDGALHSVAWHPTEPIIAAGGARGLYVFRLNDPEA